MRTPLRSMLFAIALLLPVISTTRAIGSEPSTPIEPGTGAMVPAQANGGAAGQCSILGTWGAANPYASLTVTFGAGGTGTWDVRNRNGDNGGAMTYTFSGGTLNLTNTSVTHQEDPHFFPCLGLPGSYRASFSSDCNSLIETAVSDACPVRRAMTLTRRP